MTVPAKGKASEAAWALATDTHLYLLESEGLLFCEGLQSVFSLNTMASFIWLQAEAGLNAKALANLMAETFALPKATVRRYIKDMRQAWWDLGLLEGAPRPAPAQTNKQSVKPAKTARPHDGKLARVRFSCRYDVLGRSYRVRYRDLAAYWAVDPLLNHLTPRGRGESEGQVDVFCQNGQFHVLIDKRDLASCEILPELAPLLMARLFWNCFAYSRPFMTLHAAALKAPKGALLLPAKGGGGKTTLAAALVQAGFHYLTDDVCLLQDKTLAVRGLSYPLSIKQRGVGPLTPIYPDLPNTTPFLRPDGVAVHYLMPLKFRLPAKGRRGEAVRWIIFPSFQPGAMPKLEAIPRPQALRLLMEMAAQPRYLDQAAVAMMVDWIQSIECYALTVSDLPSTVRLLQDLVRGR